MIDKNRRFSKTARMKAITHQSLLDRLALRVTILGLALVPMCSRAQISIPMVSVGNPNPADTTGFGSVGYNYDIGTYEVLNWQYAGFLSAVGASDTYNLYNTSMASDARGGILRSGVAGSYTYSLKAGSANYANMPVVFVSYYDALRFANWMQNGQPSGPQGPGTTETGTYTFSGETVVGGRNPLPTFYALASENEWYKAAYYDQSLNSGGGGYWLYPTMSNVVPKSRPPNGTDPNSANFYRDDGIANGYNGGFAVTQATAFNNGVNYLSVGGAYSASSSFYGTFDQGGNVFEWDEGISGPNRIERGGSWDQQEARLRATSRLAANPTFENYNLGYRLVYIPEPSAFALLGVGVLLLLAGQRFGRR
jgi:formylglycine-generating enzyme required for sulfatase activity